MTPLVAPIFGRAVRPLLYCQRRNIVKLVRTTDEYHAGITATDYVVAKFGASWCKPCQLSKAFVEELSTEYPELMFIEVDVDELPQVADAEGVKSIPMYKIFKHGKSIDVHIGGSKQQLKEVIEQYHVPSKSNKEET